MQRGMTLYYNETTKDWEPNTGTSGAPNVSTQSGSVWAYGIWPASYYDGTTAIAQTATASGTVLTTLIGLENYNGITIEVAAIGGTTPVINAFPSVDGAIYAATALGWVNLQTGATISGATGLTAIGIYALLMRPTGATVKFKNVRLTITGGAADLTTTSRVAKLWA